MRIKSTLKEPYKYDVVEEDKASFKFSWDSDIKFGEHVEAWTLQLMTHADGLRYRSRWYSGLVVVSADSSGNRWKRVGHYSFHIFGWEAWLYGDEWGDKTTITLI